MTFREEMEAEHGYAEDDNQTWREIAEHGCDAGFSGLIYITEAAELYDRHEDEIYECLNQDAEDFGLESVDALTATFARKDMLGDPMTRKNLLAWYMAERIANEIAND